MSEITTIGLDLAKHQVHGVDAQGTMVLRKRLRRGQVLAFFSRASTSRPSGEWNDDDFDVLCDGVVAGWIMKAAAVPVGMSWMWTLAFGHHEDRMPTHGYAATREAAMAAFAKSWQPE
jgi:hypothetical protein